MKVKVTLIPLNPKGYIICPPGVSRTHHEVLLLGGQAWDLHSWTQTKSSCRAVTWWGVVPSFFVMSLVIWQDDLAAWEWGRFGGLSDVVTLGCCGWAACLIWGRKKESAKMVGVSIINLGRHCPGRPAGDTQETLMPSRPTWATGAFSSQSLIKWGLLPSQFTQLWRFQRQGSD